MQHSFFTRLSRFCWVLLVLAVVLLATYVSVGRLAMLSLNAYRAPLLNELNHRLPFNVHADQVQGRWRSFSPEVVLKQLRVAKHADADASVKLDQGMLSVNVWQSLLTRSLQLNHLELRGLNIQAQLTRDGKFLVAGLDGGTGESNDWLYDFVSNIERITLSGNALTLSLPSGETRVMDLDLALQRTGSHRQVQGQLSSTAGTQVSILANGVGDLLRPETLTGSAYVKIDTPDLAAMRALLGPEAPPLWSTGSGEVALWLTLSQGEPTVEAELRAIDLSVYSDDGRLALPLDEVSVRGQLSRDERHWTLHGSDMLVRQGDTAIRLPRIQLDTWGTALRLRMQEVPLEPVNTMITGLSLVPESLREIFTTLAPRGTLPAVQLNIGDWNRPSVDWELDATFEELAVDSFKGAPGVDAATGYAQLKPGGGSVTLDSQSLSLAFPSIYHNPLAFDEVYGTLDLRWNPEVVALSSGLLTAYGEEGKAHVLFGLDIPLEKTEAGVEMQLLVGLENSDTQFRDKYIPYTLSSGLRQWLADSIGEGTIEQGAFLWRGSLRKDGAALRTVQLAFNVSETRLNYHPQWPGVDVGVGQVLIDDAAVSVWSDEATLYDSRVENMSVELSLDAQRELQLAIDGKVTGPAQDGLRVVNESALTGIVGDAFKDWEVQGALQADLAVAINLTDKQAPPRVSVDTLWQDTALTIRPGNLTVDALAGDFSYSTREGFSSETLEGRLWGRPVSLSLSQEHASGSSQYDARTSTLTIAAESEIAVDSVRNWLGLDLLSMASGTTAARMDLSIAPRTRPRLQVSSGLEGVTTQLPSPYGKSAEDAQQFVLDMTLGSGGLPLQLRLDDALTLDLAIDSGGLSAGALGIEARPTPLEPGVFKIGGQAGQVDGDSWLRFLGDYFGLGDVLEPAVADGSLDAAAETSDQTPLAFRVDDLGMDVLSLWGRQFSDVTLQLSSGSDAWELAAVAEGLRGTAALRRAPQASDIRLESIDLDLLQPGPAAGNEDVSPTQDVIEVPPLNIAVEQVLRGDQPLGRAAFSLRSVGSVLQVKDLVGEYAGMALTDESPGQILWRQGEGGNTTVEGIFEFGDLADTLSWFDYQQILRTESGRLDVQLRWPGTPAEFSVGTAEGAILVDFGSGNFLEAPSGAAGALRVVNILNLADIVRRLSLTHMFESGIPFDSVEGEIYFHGGTIEVARMAVDGSSSFQFQGVSEVATRSLNGELVATLPVANNLPWVAALAASLPVAAGVFVVSKVFDKQMSKLSSAVYAIEGTWDEPNVEFDRIFDDRAKTVELPSGQEPATEGVEQRDP